MNIKEFALDLGVLMTIERALSLAPEVDAMGVLNAPVEWEFRLKTSAGRGGRRGITLHPGLKAEGQAEITKTFLHEVAHVMQGWGKQPMGHGVMWVWYMGLLGARPEVYHNLAACRGRAEPEELTLDDL